MFASKDVFLTPPSTGGYTIARSVRLRSSASAYFNRTPSSASNRKTWTWSGWVKFSNIVSNSIFSTSTGAVLYQSMFAGLTSGSALQFYSDISGLNTFNLVTTQVFRDPSAWYHLVIAFDTTQATASNRAKIYVNGVQVTAFSTSTYPTQNIDYDINNNARPFIIGSSNSAAYLDGYLTEINFVDGQALTPSSFGSTNTITGVWQPIKYTGTYGTNGFYLNFSDNSSNTATTIGKDYSGNGNNWTPNNISVTAGATYDSMTDVPTLTSATAANYAVLNAVSGYSGLPLTAANIQTSAVPSGGNWYSRSATMGISSGKWYAEFTMPSITSGAQGNPAGIGIIPASNDFSAAGQMVGDTSRGYGFYCPDTTGAAPVRRVSSSNTSVGTGTATSTSDVFMVAFDLTSGTAWFGKNGTWYAGDPSAGTGASITGITSAEYVFAVSIYRDTTFTNNTVALNFGQRLFSYTPPTGYVALNTYNLPAGTITTTGSFTGNASTDGPFVYLNGVPTTMTINGNAVTFGTNADKLANGFKVRSSSSSYNASGSNTYSITTTGANFKNANAQTNP